MPMYVKNPIEIEAIQLCHENTEKVRRFVGSKGGEIGASRDTCVDNCGEVGPWLYLEIKTLEGTVLVYHGAYIIKGIEGEFYPCRPDIFRKTYKLIRN